MVGLFKVVGGLVMAVAVVMAIWMVAIGGISGFFAGLIVILLWGFCGAAIFTFGLMLEHLVAIRQNSTEQSEMLTELLRRIPKTGSPHRESTAQSIDQLTKSNFRFRDI